MKKTLLTLALLALLSIGAKAQIGTLMSFNGTNGANPGGSLISDGTYFYGMTSAGGANGGGTIFKIKPNGTGYVDLFDFDNNNYGGGPFGTLISDGTYLYGTAANGGVHAGGIIFKIKTDGTGFVDLFDFNSSVGQSPEGSLISDGTYLYGTTSIAGVNGSYDGTLFKIKTDGTSFDTLLTFNGTNGGSPYGSLLSDGTYLYGMTGETSLGGGNGNIFKIKTDGTGFDTLMTFNGANGSQPFGSLISDGTYFYGMTYEGAANGFGNVFKIKTDGTGYIDLFDFNDANGYGAHGSLITDGTYLYGMTTYGGANTDGNIFKIKTDGTGFVNLADFNGTNGFNPYGDLLLVDGTFYGMTSIGGATNQGVIFKYTPALGAALNFDGADDYVTTPLTLNGTSGTWEAWIQKADWTDEHDDRLFGNGINFTDANAFYVSLHPSVGFHFRYGGGTDANNMYIGNLATQSLSASSWHHLAATWNFDGTNTTISIYLDGVSLGSNTGAITIPVNASSFYIGGGGDAANPFFGSGNMDEVRVWNRALCAEEIQNNMTGEIPVNSTGLIAYYKFNQGYAGSDNTTISTLADSTSNAYNGTLTNFALNNATSNFVTPGAVTTGSLVTAFTNTLSAVATQTNVTCNGNGDGIASVAISGIESPFTYNWSAGGSTTNAVTSLAPGNYTCTIGNACGTIAQTFTITQPDALVASSTSGSILCNAGSTNVTVTETGGTSPYSGDGVMSNITANDYTYTVTDANGCASTTTITVTEPTALVASSSANAIACHGGVTTVTVTETGGVSPYTVSGDATSNVIAGSYSYTVTDANGCTSPATITLNDPAAIDASVTSIGDIITATNATATYQWVDCNNANAPIVGETNQSYTAIISGNYAVIVTEGSCSATSTCTPITTSGIAQNKTANSLTVYPNPFSNELTIVSTAKTNAMLFDMLGNQIKSFALQSTTQTISLSDLAPGMYYLQVDAQKIKIIKQ